MTRKKCLYWTIQQWKKKKLYLETHLCLAIHRENSTQAMRLHSWGSVLHFFGPGCCWKHLYQTHRKMYRTVAGLWPCWPASASLEHFVGASSDPGRPLHGRVQTDPWGFEHQWVQLIGRYLPKGTPAVQKEPSTETVWSLSSVVFTTNVLACWPYALYTCCNIRVSWGNLIWAFIFVWGKSGF